MKAMVLRSISPVAEGYAPLDAVDRPDPIPADGEILIRVHTCGVCHTELDEIEGRTPPERFPIIPGHQVVGRVAAIGPNVHRYRVGERVGVGWIYSSCGDCVYCRRGEENLCDSFRATGRDFDGGYAELMIAREGYAYPIPARFTDLEAAPLLCAGAIGYRALRLSGLSDGDSLGLLGFGASAHLVLQMVRGRFPRARVYVFARDPSGRDLARSLGAEWTGEIGAEPPERLRAIIDTTPVWGPIVRTMKCLAPGGRMVVNAIRKEDVDKQSLVDLDYGRDLWMEHELKSVANVARRDIRECLELATEIGIKPEIREFPLREANRALIGMRARGARGAVVLRVADA